MVYRVYRVSDLRLIDFCITHRVGGLRAREPRERDPRGGVARHDDVQRERHRHHVHDPARVARPRRRLPDPLLQKHWILDRQRRGVPNLDLGFGV